MERPTKKRQQVIELATTLPLEKLVTWSCSIFQFLFLAWLN